MKNTELLLKFLRKSKRYFFLGILFAVILSLFELINPKIIAFGVDSVIGTEPFSLPEFLRFSEKYITREFLSQQLWLLAGAVIAVSAVSMLSRYLFRLFNSKGAETLVHNMRHDLYDKIASLPQLWYSQNHTGDIIQRCTSDVEVIKVFLSEQLTSVFRITVLIVMSLIFMFLIDPAITLIAAVSVPIIILYSTIFYKKIGSSFQKCDENEGKLSAVAQENLTGVRVVRAFGREKYETDKFKAQNSFYTGLWLKLMKLLSLYWGMGDLISGLQVMLVIVFGTVRCVNGDLSVGNFIALISYNAMLVWPVRQLGRMIAQMSKAGISLERINHIMNSDSETDIPGALTPDMSGDIEFKDVTFGFASEDILKNVSFTVKGGSTFGILGGSGSGKSTLMLLLDRIYRLPCDGKHGEICIGNVNIAEMQAKWVRKNIGYCLQEPFLFSGTLRENLCISAADDSEEALGEAITTACLDSTIAAFSKGCETYVGERGVTLSGGQKQRSAIARMLMRKSKIIVLDDSLSAVDTQTDYLIRSALKKHTEGVTTIIVSHRITTLMGCDKILVLERGSVAETGSHEELLENNGIYKKIYDIQLSSKEEAAK